MSVSVSDIKNLSSKISRIKNEFAKVIVGQDDIIEKIIICLLTESHCLLVGVPGLAKTLIVKTFSDIMGLEYKRIQFTPDLMPSDITGTELIQQNKETGERSFSFHKGPIFSNIVLGM